MTSKIETLSAAAVGEGSRKSPPLAQGIETNQRQNVGEFFAPTAHELDRFIQKITRDSISNQNAEQDNCFANVLNRGSSLE